MVYLQPSCLRLHQLLCQRQSKYQNIEVHDTPSFGNLLRIDGSFMASEKDEFSTMRTWCVYPPARMKSQSQR